MTNSHFTTDTSKKNLIKILKTSVKIIDVLTYDEEDDRTTECIKIKLPKTWKFPNNGEKDWYSVKMLSEYFLKIAKELQKEDKTEKKEKGK